MVTEWRIFYKDRKVITDLVPVLSVPTENVLLIVQKGSELLDGQFILNGGSYYWWDDNKWNISNNKPKNIRFLNGVLVNKKVWRQAKVDAINYAKL